jgi:hypothetical protein
MPNKKNDVSTNLKTKLEKKEKDEEWAKRKRMARTEEAISVDSNSSMT